MNVTAAPAASVSPAPTASIPAVDIRDVVYAYAERRALYGLTLSVPAGSIFGLLGPNASGKSTLLSLLIGRRTADSGEVAVLGERVTPKLRSRMAIVFQEPSLDPQMTATETMRLQARMFGLPHADADTRAAMLLERVGLTDRRAALTSTLSGGMKRRLELARALLTGPELILLDEPTLALDPDSRLALWDHLVEANAAGCTLLVATNDVAEAERYCHRVALIADGRLVAEGAPDELKRGLRHETVRVEWRDVAAAPIATIAGWPDVGGTHTAGRTTQVTVDAASPFLARLFQEYGDQIHGLRVDESTLEDVYFQLVGRGIASRSEEI